MNRPKLNRVYTVRNNSSLQEVLEYRYELEKYCDKLEKALDKACEELGKMCKQTKCKDCHFVKEQVNEDNDCPVQGNITYCDWKEWCLKDVE